MAITQVGGIQWTRPFGGTHANTGTVNNEPIIVPAETELVVIGVAAHASLAGALELATLTKNGIDEPMVTCVGGDITTAWMGKLFYMVLPDIGDNQTLKWDWKENIVTTTAGGWWSLTFWKGIDMDNPVRDSNGAQPAGFPFTTPTLTAQTGDKLLTWVSFYNDNGLGGTIDSWTGATLLEQGMEVTSYDGAWAITDPTSNQTVSAASGTNVDAAAICSIVLRPGPGGIQYVVPGNSVAVAAGDALGVPIRFATPEVTGLELAVATGEESVTENIIEGKTGIFGWSVR